MMEAYMYKYLHYILKLQTYVYIKAQKIINEFVCIPTQALFSFIIKFEMYLIIISRQVMFVLLVLLCIFK